MAAFGRIPSPVLKAHGVLVPTAFLVRLISAAAADLGGCDYGRLRVSGTSDEELDVGDADLAESRHVG
jgi:hypothetical protein